MKDVRITLRGEDFAAVSQSMVDMGVRFQVEPLAGEDEDAVATAAAPKRAAAKRKPQARSARSTAQSASAAGERGQEASGAARLRAMVERNRAAVQRPAGEPGEGDAGSPADEPS
jgi:hypothetical protein